MFKKQPKPTFRAIVPVGAAGEEFGLFDLEFNYLRRGEFNAMLDEVRAGRVSEAEMLRALIAGWNHTHPESAVDAPYTPEAIDQVLDMFWTFGADVTVAYVRAAAEGKRKN